MPKTVNDGSFYEFNREAGNYEVGREITESFAQWEVRYQRDVYTPRASDAKRLAKKICKQLAPEWHPAHQPRYFPHYYPRGDEKYGHIFYGRRGEHFEVLEWS